MPFPLPYASNQKPWMPAQMVELRPVQRQTARMEQENPEVEERNEQEEVKGRHNGRTDLRNEMVQPESRGKHDHQQGGDSYRWVDSDHHPQREAPRQATGCYATAQLAKDRPQDAAPGILAYGFRNQHTTWDA